MKDNIEPQDMKHDEKGKEVREAENPVHSFSTPSCHSAIPSELTATTVSWRNVV